MKTELLPCPFCGGKPAFVPRAINIVLQKDPSNPKFGVSVICGRCSAESANVIDEGRAAEKWNARAIDAPIATQPQAPQGAVTDAIQQNAKAAIKHWNEFGPEFGFAVCMDLLQSAIEAKESS